MPEGAFGGGPDYHPMIVSSLQEVSRMANESIRLLGLTVGMPCSFIMRQGLMPDST